jgi:hypothetical protein
VYPQYIKTKSGNYSLEIYIASGKSRVDAIDINQKIVRDLKPDTRSGHKAGASQLRKYTKALEMNHLLSEGTTRASWMCIDEYTV